MIKQSARSPLLFVTSALFCLGLSSTLGCGESREEKMRRAIRNGLKDPEADPAKAAKPVPADPTRDALAPLLKKLYSGERLPDVLSGEVPGDSPYQVTPGVLSRITVRSGLAEPEKAMAIIRGTAEADAWVHRPKARKNYADHIHKIFRGFGADQRDAVMRTYADLKLLDFFNRPETAALVSGLPASVQSAASQVQTQYKGAQDKIWDKWMAVKMYARREVSVDQPFRPLLRSIQKKLGKEEPAPISWEKAHDAPFQAWAATLKKDRELFAKLTNLKEYRDQVEFQGDTHAIWAKEGSSLIPAKAKGIEIDRKLGFGSYREDLGGGYQEMVFVFPKKLKGAKLKKAYLRSQIYRHIFSDFQLLATVGRDFEGGQVPNKYDPAYAYCGSEAALDSLLSHYGKKYSIFAGVRPSMRNGDKILKRAHKCIIKRCAPDIKNPPKNDPNDIEGPAPGSRLGFFQMLARFENPKVNLEKMRQTAKKSQAEIDAEAFLKSNPNAHQ